MANKKSSKRRRKHSGSQAGYVDSHRRPKTRKQAQKVSGDRRDRPPTWTGSFWRGLFATLVFLILMMFLFDRTLGQALPVAGVMLLIYIVLSYQMDRILYRRRLAAKERAKAEARAAQRQPRA